MEPSPAKKYARRQYDNFYVYVNDKNTSFTPDFDPRVVNWYSEGEPEHVAKNFEHMYKTLARFHLFEGEGGVELKHSILPSLFNLCDYAKQNASPLGIPFSVVCLLLPFLGVSPVWVMTPATKTRLHELLRMCAKQVLSVCQNIMVRLKASSYCTFSDENKVFVEETGMVPMNVQGFRELVGSVKEIFLENQEIVDTCNAILEHIF